MRHIVSRLRQAVNSCPPIVWLLGFGTLVNVFGLSFIWPITTVYIHEHLGRPTTVAAWVLMLQSGGAVLGSLAGGALFDRIGARRVLLLALAASTVVIALPAFSGSWPLYVAVMGLYGVTSNLPGPAINALVARAWPSGGRRAYNFLYVAHNVGVAVGTAVGGVLAERSFRTAFLGASVMALVFAVFVFLAIFDDRIGTGAAGEVAAGADASGEEAGPTAIRWVPVMALWSGFLMLWLIYVQWLGAVPVTMQDNGMSLKSYSLLWTLNGLIIVLGQPLVAIAVRFVRSLFAQMLLGTVLFAGSYLFLLNAHSYGRFVAGMVVLTLGEMLAWPAVPSATAQLSPPERRGFLQGFIGGAATAGRMVGPLLGDLLFDHAGFQPLVVAAVVAYVLPVGCFLLYQRTSGGVMPMTH